MKDDGHFKVSSTKSVGQRNREERIYASPRFNAKPLLRSHTIFTEDRDGGVIPGGAGVHYNARRKLYLHIDTRLTSCHFIIKYSTATAINYSERHATASPPTNKLHGNIFSTSCGRKIAGKNSVYLCLSPPRRAIPECLPGQYVYVQSVSLSPKQLDRTRLTQNTPHAEPSFDLANNRMDNCRCPTGGQKATNSHKKKGKDSEFRRLR